LGVPSRMEKDEGELYILGTYYDYISMNYEGELYILGKCLPLVCLLLLQDEYELLCHKIEDASQKSRPCDFIGEFVEFSNIERKNHPTIVKVNTRLIDWDLGNLIFVHLF
jgi:hypothetical protein